MISSLLPECRQQGNEELTILLVIGVAVVSVALRQPALLLLYLHLPASARVVNLTNQNIETVTEVFHFRAVR